MLLFNSLEMIPYRAGSWRVNICGIEAFINKENKKSANGDHLYSAEFLNRVMFNLTQEEALKYIEGKFKELTNTLLEKINGN